MLDKFLEPASTLVGLPAKAKAGCIIYIYFKEASIFLYLIREDWYEWIVEGEMI